MVNLTAFLYFAYASNMLAKRIHIKNPSAKRAGIAKLEDHRLDFSRWSKRWCGAAATIVKDNTATVWGALWVISNKHKQSLDKQEGVSKGIYKVYQIRVEMPNGTTIKCRSYQLTRKPLKLKKGRAWPEKRKPSLTYLSTIIAGAKESGLPLEYIQQLEMIPHNSYNGPAPYDNNTSSSTTIVITGKPTSSLLLLAIIYLNSR